MKTKGYSFSFITKLIFELCHSQITELHSLNLCFPFFHYISGAYGECFISGSKVECLEKFIREPLTLEIDTKVCQKPIKFDIKISIPGMTFNKEYYGTQDIPLPELSILGYGDIVLSVDANYLDNGDLQLKVRRRCI